MTPHAATTYLLGLQSRGIKLDLDRMRATLRDLGHPERAFPVVLVTGTNGKGSTASALASILRAAGQRVGLFSSPHLVDYRERIRIEGRMISPPQLVHEVERGRAVWEKNDLTFFEVGVAMALSAFRDAKVDVAVLEIGLGGRLDATNTTEPCLSVVASIGFDHVHILGGTLEQIATEKAGIFRPGVPAIVQDGYARAVATLRRRAAELGTPLRSRRELVTVTGIEPTRGLGMRFHVAPRSPSIGLEPEGRWLEIGHCGRHQVANTTLAALAARAAGGLPGLATWEEIALGLSRWRWPGRLDPPHPELPLLFDAGHNREAGQQLANALTSYAAGRPLELVVGMVEKKDHYGYLRPLRALTDRIRLALPRTPRAAAFEDLDGAARRAGFRVEWSGSVGEALEAALGAARSIGGSLRAPGDGEAPLVVLAGSLFVLEEGYRHLGLAPAEEI